MLGFVDVGAGRGVDLERGIDAAAIEIDAIQDLLAVLGESGGRVAVELKWQAGVKLNSAGDPEARSDLIANACAKGVALILRIREMAGERDPDASEPRKRPPVTG